MREGICHTYDPRSSESDLAACRCVTKHRSLLLLLFSSLVVYNSLRPRGRQHARLLCPSPSPGVCSDSQCLRNSHFCPASQQGSVRGWGFWCCHSQVGARGSKGRKWRLLPWAPHFLLVTGQRAGAGGERVKAAIFGEKVAQSLKYTKIF